MDLKELSSDLGDWEYLSNPEGYELNPEQLAFLEFFYPEYANRDPFAVMKWLYAKAKHY